MMPDPSPNNRALERFAPALYGCLSPLGLRAAFPRGIVYQAEVARGASLNATIGQVTDGRGNPLPLPSLDAHLGDLDRKVALLYAPQAGHAELRKLWLAWQLEQAGRTSAVCTLPYTTHGLTHGLSLVADLFADHDTTVLLPSPAWENYELLFGLRAQARVVTWSFFRDGRFSPDAFGEATRALRGKAIVLLNFPSNPTGYSPDLAEVDAMITHLQAMPGPTLVVVDDAYQGVVHTADAVPHSIFWDLAERLDPARQAVVKVDGATKELLFFPCRVGFLTAALPPEAHAAWEDKVNTIVRATAGSPPGPSQALMLPLLRDPERTRLEVAVRQATISTRYRALRTLLDGLANPRLKVFPFNSAYFALVGLDRSLSAGDIRRQLLADRSVGTVALPEVNALRLAYCSLDEQDLPALVRHLDEVVRGA